MSSSTSSSGRVVFVCGPTGSGKSAVSIELAKKLNGEIVNGDAFQMYKGLSIATAKVTEDEMNGVPHHLLSLYDPKHTVNVNSFVDSASEVINDIHCRGSTPIVVGGSNFYVESLIFANSLSKQDVESGECANVGSMQEISALSHTEMYEKLKSVDPATADIMHPADHRRIFRALFRHFHGELAKNEDSSVCNGDALSLRYPDCIVVRVSSGNDQDQIARLRNRVDKMMSAGLLDEAYRLYNYLISDCNDWDTYDVSATTIGQTSTATKHGSHNVLHGGVAEAIGFKEMILLLSNIKKSSVDCVSPNCLSPENNRLLSAALESIKVATVQYAKKQATWIKNRLTPRCESSGVPIIDYCANSGQGRVPRSAIACSSLSELVENITNIKMRGVASDSKNGQSTMNDRILLKRKIFHCPTCGEKSFQGKDQFDIHMKSKSHKKRIASQRRKESNMKNKKKHAISS